MNLINDKILIRVTSESREGVMQKVVTTDSGEKVSIWKEIQATDDMDERASFLMVQTGVVEEVSSEVGWIKKGDIALINYDVCNSKERLVYSDDEGDVYWIAANTTYHKEDEIAYQNQRSQRDQIVHSAGDYDELSPLLGIIQDNSLIANCPFVFLTHESNTSLIVSKSGIIHEKTSKMLDRKVLAISKESSVKYGINANDVITVDDYDIFGVKLDEGYLIDCINDVDVLSLVI